MHCFKFNIPHACTTWNTFREFGAGQPYKTHTAHTPRMDCPRRAALRVLHASRSSFYVFDFFVGAFFAFFAFRRRATDALDVFQCFTTGRTLLQLITTKYHIPSPLINNYLIYFLEISEPRLSKPEVNKPEQLEPGKKARIVCKVRGFPIPFIVWKKNETVLHSNSNIRITYRGYVKIHK